MATFDKETEPVPLAGVVSATAKTKGSRTVAVAFFPVAAEKPEGSESRCVMFPRARGGFRERYEAIPLKMASAKRVW